jgi:hypothetical protein
VHFLQKDIRTPGTFNAIENHCSLDVIIVQGDEHKVVVVSPEKYLDKIKTTVQANTLIIDIKGNLRYSNENLYIIVTLANLNEITNHGSADFEIDGTFNTESLFLDMHGSGDFEGDLNVKDLEVKIAGSGDVELSGINGSIQVYQYGSGDFEAESVYVGSSYFKINGSGDCEVSGSSAMMELTQNGSGDFDGRGFEVKTAKIRKAAPAMQMLRITETLDARLSGSGDLNVKGNPGNNPLFGQWQW